MNIAQLPVEVLQQILHTSHITYATLNLWKAGSKTLNSKLASVVTHVHLMQDFGSAGHFPHLIPQFRTLRYLSLSHHRRLVKNPTDWIDIMQGLPPTLESLSLESTDCQWALMNFAPDWSINKPTYIKTRFKRGNSSLFDMEERLPRLRTLKLKYRGEGAWQPIRTQDLPGLPSTLTSLTTSYLHFCVSKGESLALLPSSLRVIKASIEVKFDAEPSPQYLLEWTHGMPLLERVGSISARGSLKHYNWLPRSLMDIKNVIQASDIEDVRSLPHGLKSLQYGSQRKPFVLPTSSDWTTDLPSSLTALSLFGFPLLGEELAFLPRTLISLTAPDHIDFDWKKLEILIQERGIDAFWPPHLQTISRLLVSNSDPLELLPKTLQSLFMIIRSSTLPLNLDGQLPESITNLEIQNEKDAHGLSDVVSLPPKLTRLSHFSAIEEGTFLNRSNFENLPTSLLSLSTHLLASEGKFDSITTPWRSPPNLVKFVTNAWHLDWISSLPKSITILSIGMLYGLSKASQEKRKRLFEQLPPKLTVLTIKKSDKGSTTKFSAEVFSKLPHIVNLELGENFGYFPSHSIKYWPKTLRTVTVNLKSLDQDDVPHISPRLTHVSLEGARVDWNLSYIAKYWPLAATETIPMRSKVFKLLQIRRAELDQ